MTFFDRLSRRAVATGSLLCVGLDPHLADLSTPTAEAALTYCRNIVAATRPYACAFKPNAAFFEALGAPGVAALGDLISDLEPEIPVILDAKRGDIASTAAAYATACFDVLGAGAVTLHPYLGRDSIAPFLAHQDRGVFVLCRTSNPGAAELQELATETGDPMYVTVATAVRNWDAARCGLVVGATAPGALPAVRRVNPDAWILAPGVGAQGGSLQETVAAAVRPDGLGLLISVSRGIARAPDPARAAAALVAQISAARTSTLVQATALSHGDNTKATAQDQMGDRTKAGFLATDQGQTLADGLLTAGCVRFGSFTLKSGLTSPIYLDLRQLSGDPALLGLAAQAYAARLEGLQFDRLAALPYAGLPIGTAVSLAGQWPLIYPRKQRKAHGTGAAIEGPFKAGETAVVIDDLATRGTSAREALPTLRDAGLHVGDLVVLVDRGSGAQARLAEDGVRLHAVFQLPELLDHWQASGAVSINQATAVRTFLQESV
ncbi:MAG: orotidine-5'-phosphate decarboxylase [Myxococcales bacterium]|nr:orotidine-5'-phosphate decarboxylase [Myxococcales bacterium]